MGVQRIQETSTASYGKSVEAAAAGNSSGRQRKCYRRHNADSGEHHDSMEGRKQKQYGYQKQSECQKRQG